MTYDEEGRYALIELLFQLAHLHHGTINYF